MDHESLIYRVLSHFIPSLAGIVIIGTHIHGSDRCPHFEVELIIQSKEPVNLYPLRDSKRNNLIETVTIMPTREESTHNICVQVNIQTLERTLEILNLDNHL